MPVVETSTEIPDVPIAQIWETLCNFSEYPRTMSDVLDVKFLSRSDCSAVSAWRVLLNGSELTWTETDTFEAPNQITFEQLEGDLMVFRGRWRLESFGSAVRVSLRIEFDIGIPSLAHVLDPIGIQAVRANAHQMIDAIRRTSTRQE